MAKAASSTTKETVSGKKTTTSKSRTRAQRQTAETVTASPSAPEPDALVSIFQRIDALEEKISASFSGLAEELHTRETPQAPGGVESEAITDSTLPLVADLLRRNLMEYLTPVMAGLKRLEERIGFVANRLKHGGSGSSSGGGGGPDRQKPWRHEQGRHARPPRPQQNGQRPQNQGQPQPWTPPSAASVQGHFAPRPLPSRGLTEEEE